MINISLWYEHFSGLLVQSGGMSAEEFKIALQEATNFPVRPYVLPFLKSHIPLLQREIASQARSCNQVSCVCSLRNYMNLNVDNKDSLKVATHFKRIYSYRS